MNQYFTVLGLFQNIEDVSRTVKPLEEMGIRHDHAKLLSSAPYPEGTVFGSSRAVPLYKCAFAGGISGLILAMFLAGGTQVLVNLDVSGMDPFSFSPVALIGYEFSLLGAVIGTFIGMLWMQGLPNWNDLAYDTEVYYGKIGLLICCETNSETQKIISIMKEYGAVRVREGKDDF